ncbi:hypothetical protein Tco_1337290 [Tanacetum coccineum]
MVLECIEGLAECEASTSNLRRIQLKDSVKEVEDYLKTYSSAGMDISCRSPKMLRVESLRDHPLIKYGFNTIERSTHADIANSNNLVTARNELMRTIAEKEELIKNYRAM